MTSFVKLVLPNIFIIRKFSCFFYDTMISYYLLNCHAYYKRYCKYYSHRKDRYPRKFIIVVNIIAMRKDRYPRKFIRVAYTLLFLSRLFCFSLSCSEPIFLSVTFTLLKTALVPAFTLFPVSSKVLSYISRCLSYSSVLVDNIDNIFAVVLHIFIILIPRHCRSDCITSYKYSILLLPIIFARINYYKSNIELISKVVIDC